MARTSSTLRNFVWLTGGTVVNRLGKFALFYGLGYFLPESTFGHLAYANACWLLANALSDFGISRAAPPRLALARSEEDLGVVEGRFLATKVAFTAVTISLWLIWTFVHPASDLRRTLLLLFTPGILLNELALEWFYRGRGHLRLVGITRALSVLVILPVGLALAARTETRAYIPLAFSAGYLLLVVVQGAGMYRPGLWQSTREGFGSLGETFRESHLYGLSMFIWRAYAQLPFLLLALLLGASAVGKFKLVHMPFFFALACGKWMADSAIAEFSRGVKERPRAGKAILLRCGAQLGLLSVVGGLLTAGALPFALNRFYPTYGTFVPLAAGMGAVLPVATLGLFGRELLPALLKPRAFLAITTLMLIVLVGALLMLAPAFGLMAVPLAYGAAEVVGLCILVPQFAAVLKRT
jgi:O-antigen/teichoic acid export membrane protein